MSAPADTTSPSADASPDASRARPAAGGMPAASPAPAALPTTDAVGAPTAGEAAGGTHLSVDEVRNALWQHGWAQGSVVPDELRAEIQRIPFAPDPRDDEIPIVITQDCDAIQGDCLVEPALEVVFARPIAKANPDCKVLKNPRQLHVDLLRPDGARQPVEVSAWRRGFIARERLVEYAPATDWCVPPDSLDLIARLFGRRYDRVAFPEAFVERFRPVAAKLDKHIKRVADEITGVFLHITPEEDLPLDEDPAVRPYEVRVLLMASYALAADEKRQSSIEHPIKTDLLQAMAKTPGLQGVEVRVASPWRLSLGEFRDFLEWDHEPLRLGLATKATVPKDAAAGTGGAGGLGGDTPVTSATPSVARVEAASPDVPRRDLPPPSPLD